MSYDPEPQPPWPADDAVITGLPCEDHIAELLNLCEEFFRHASPAVHTELRQFLTEHGYHSIAGLGAFLDSLAFTAV